MKVSRIWLLIVVGMLICSGCAGTGSHLAENPLPPNEGEQKLSAGIKSYEEGNYKDSIKLIQEALTKGLPNKERQVEAHKYLAFIHCISGRKKECTDEFKKALELNPNFELEAAEAGHPLWGPVYSSVKGATTTSAPVSAKSPTKEAAPPSSLVHKEAQAAELPPASGLSPKILVVVKTSNMRAKADSNSKIIRILKKGEKVEYLGQSKPGDWINCKTTSGLTGWVFKDLVQEAK
ncbi:MAG: TssQ family T6SS-associated lipoprotein [Syntrophales bacterium]|nr:TssQ family T6SS-associated lipoprotein [Syntrophales bacterium]